MHQLIYTVVPAQTPHEAVGFAKSHFDGPRAPLMGPFDYGKMMNDESARFRESVPQTVQETGAIEADTNDGRELIESGWSNTKQKIDEHMAVLETAFERVDDRDELLGGAMIEDVPVEGKTDYKGNPIETTDGWFTNSLRCLGSDAGPTYYLYNDYGEAVQSPSQYETLLGEIDNGHPDEEKEWYVVPMDVHW